MDNKLISTDPYWIDQTSPLFVIQHQPVSGKINKTGVIILNSGFLHNVGPYRLSVDLADLISSQGFVVARIDQSGKGESPTRLDAVGIDAKLLDFDETFDRLRADFGVSSCVLIGVCSGADDALEIAELRESVSGLVFLDGFSPVTLWYLAFHYYMRIRHFRAWLVWKKMIRDRKRRNLDIQNISTESTTILSLRRWLSENDVKSIYESILKRGVKVLAIFSGGASDYYNHHGQLTRGLKAPTDSLYEVYFHEASHIYQIPEHREQLVMTIGKWMQDQFTG